ncbi:MAG: 50S ribosomal protein L35 [Coxiellaceae bacterium]|jgi:large subunit ribosomal protein L35|nr:50S ribosomal protein L35 [Coxiellaceae bacterium]
MPKLKSNKSASKRFKKTANSSRYKHRGTFRNHILTKKSSKRKSRLSNGKNVSKCNLKAVKLMLPN